MQVSLTSKYFFRFHYQQMKWIKQEITSSSLAPPSKQENQNEDTSIRYYNIHNRISFIIRHVYPNLSARILSVVWKEGVGGVPWLRQLHTFGVKIAGGLHKGCSSYLPKQAINLDVTCQLDPRWTLKCHPDSAWHRLPSTLVVTWKLEDSGASVHWVSWKKANRHVAWSISKLCIFVEHWNQLFFI